ncbi:MAG TPA: hypothetical protein VHS81_08310 [Caulobacteraceae bacterium]|jgi:hypothetical protein|nr:hypothetical protein [Caulobacteraceae bacterium]
MKSRGLILAIAALAYASGALAEVKRCNATLDIADQDPAGLNVRASPGGPIITAVKAQGRWVEVDVTGQDGAWARIDTARLEADENDNPDEKVLWKGVGWVAFSKLGVSEFDSRARFRAEPNEHGKLVLSLESYVDKTEDAQAILGCDGDWLKVRIKGLDGWTHEWCTNQLTTCV